MPSFLILRRIILATAPRQDSTDEILLEDGTGVILKEDGDSVLLESE
jgi:hypothetical protein